MASTWAQKAEENIELFTNAGKGAEAARMLEITPANRILVDREQAIILQIGRLMQSRFMGLKYINRWGITVISPSVEIGIQEKEKVNKYQWIEEILNGVEEHQATIEARTRSDFKEVAIAQGIGLVNKVKGELGNLASR